MRRVRFSKVARIALASVATGVVATALTAPAASAGPRPRVRPHQVFEGLVNGSRGASGPVTIFVGCHDPSQATGHPVGGTVEILPAASSADPQAGKTGDNANEVEVFFDAPSHSGVRTSVVFHDYARVRPIPKHMDLPCSGTGRVTFEPVPSDPPSSKAAIVPVRYLPQP